MGEGKPEWAEKDLSEQKTNKFNSQQEAMSRNQTLGTLMEGSSHQHVNPSPLIAQKKRSQNLKGRTNYNTKMKEKPH